MKKIFIDLETTGVNPKLHSIHQIAMLIEINGQVVAKHNLFVRPHIKALIEPEAMEVGNVTEEQIKAYPTRLVIYKKLIKILSRYIDRYNPADKAYFIGFNSRAFDEIFLRAFFEQMDDDFFGSWFWSDGLDVMVLASQYLIDRRPDMNSFKLKRVAKELGIVVDEDKLHDGIYDVEITREIYNIVTGIIEEI